MSAPFPSLTKTWHTKAYPAISPLKPELSAAGKNIVITGGGSGIGAETAQFFAQAGAANVSLLGRTERALSETKQALENDFPALKVLTFVADVTKKSEVDEAFSGIQTAVGQIYVLVSNAGYLQKASPVVAGDVEDWWKCFEINTKGSFLVIQAFHRFTAANATVINVASCISHMALAPNYSAYAASKAASVRLFDSLQEENPDLRVVNIQPGVIGTNMGQKGGFPGMDELSLPAAFTVWLASSEAAFVKGKYLWVNWDVEEMKERQEEIAGSSLVTVGLTGWPF